MNGVGNGTITRRFLAVDAVGNVSVVEFEQVITIIGCNNLTAPGGETTGATRGGNEVSAGTTRGSVRLLSNYPNPSNTTTRIPFYLPTDGKAIIEVYDARGSRVFSYQGDFIEGLNELDIDVSEMNGGLYFYKLNFGKQQMSNRMIIVRD